ncbi:hypothetical protein ACQ86D_13850 [Streptomyces galilaeus]
MTDEQPDTSRKLTRLQLDNAARNVLRTAREARAALRDGHPGTAEILDELLLDFTAMTGRPVLLQPAVRTPEEAERLIRRVAEAAVFVRAHNWHPSDLRAILLQLGASQRREEPHGGERLVAEFLDGLGTLKLVESDDGADWEFRLAKEAAAGDEMSTTVVKATRYLLHPSFLMLFGDVTELLGNAVYATNVERFDECVADIEGLTTELPPFTEVRCRDVDVPEPCISVEDINRLLGLEPDEWCDPEAPGQLKEPEKRKNPEELEELEEPGTSPLTTRPDQPGSVHRGPRGISDGQEGCTPESFQDIGEWGPHHPRPLDDEFPVPDDGPTLDL